MGRATGNKIQVIAITEAIDLVKDAREQWQYYYKVIKSIQVGVV